MLTKTIQQEQIPIPGKVRHGYYEITGLIDNRVFDTLKVGLDLFAALVLLVLSAPVIALFAVLVRLTSKGPAFYTQVRVGKNGRHFTIYKLRSMLHDSEKISGACWSTAGDRRITPLGRFMRKAHIDELPQLFNVLLGHMSLVGPRPERPEFVPQLAEALPFYTNRLLVRPGLTGLAQVQLDADSSLRSVREKLAHDLFYIRARGFGLDARLLAATVMKVFGLSYARIGLLLALPRGSRIYGAYQELIADDSPNVLDLVSATDGSAMKRIVIAAEG